MAATNPFASPLGPPSQGYSAQATMGYYKEIVEMGPDMIGAMSNFMPYVLSLKQFFSKVEYKVQKSVVYGSSGAYTLSDLPEGDENVLSAVIWSSKFKKSITTYDDCMTTNKQVSRDGRADVYVIDEEVFPIATFFLQNPGIKVGPFATIFGSVFTDIAKLQPGCFVGNFECCSGCSDKGEFPGGNLNTHSLMQAITDRGSTVMCADFTAKALIRNFPLYMGTNPFIRTDPNTVSGSLALVYSPDKMNTNIAQLDLLGHFKDETGLGYACVQAAGGTICYSINPAYVPNDAQYRLSVLSVVQSQVPRPTDYTLDVTLSDNSIKKVSGDVAHCIMYFPNGGKLVVANVHWKNLTEISTSKESLISVATAAFGAEYSASIAAELDSTPATMIPEVMRAMSSRIVSRYAPSQTPASPSIEYSQPDAPISFPMADVNSAGAFVAVNPVVPEPCDYDCDATPMCPTIME